MNVHKYKFARKCVRWRKIWGKEPVFTWKIYYIWGKEWNERKGPLIDGHYYWTKSMKNWILTHYDSSNKENNLLKKKISTKILTISVKCKNVDGSFNIFEVGNVVHSFFLPSEVSAYFLDWSFKSVICLSTINSTHFCFSEIENALMMRHDLKATLVRP